jgi:hypothetical protein
MIKNIEMIMQQLVTRLIIPLNTKISACGMIISLHFENVYMQIMVFPLCLWLLS